MKQLSKKIKLGIGIGELKFGITRDSVREMLGEPESCEKYSYSNTEKDLTESWYYTTLGISVGFDEEDNWRLGLIIIN